MTEDELKRVKQLYETQYRIDFKNRAYIWNPRNPVSLLHAYVMEWELVQLLNRLDIELVGARILDVGSGYGRMLRFWAEMGASPENLFGFDLASYRLKRSQELAAGIALSNGTANELPFPADTFNVVTQFTLFSSIHDPGMRRQAADEITRVLQPGGWLIWYDVATGKGGNAQPIAEPEVLHLFSQLRLREKKPIFSRHFSRLIRISPILAVLWEHLPLEQRIGIIMLLQKQ